ncbi:2Fe-2S iron-sulfur cluster-binding protein [Mucilaginibacter dorajii]|uniref:2Fe-2S iron-sulfur cluster-binding protein n=1 Tax=Mucilaginibacter dorajii TaxID=692994 RepID=A0ABP7PBB3_9SPHI|nr:2Fe-2S iron-sulfur cluster-binding protein [Mucilaginibacter dorajii]MCS3734839.1 2Fe-2S ferredoxin [Mucilaginibacter dorajii]
MINLIIEDREGIRQPVEIPEGINLSLMEVLKASEYDVLATCGGMALCATCHVEVLEGPEQYFHASDNELDMLDTLPNADEHSRLACQMRVTEEMDGLVVRLK